jgi:predicted nucleic-acid-binding Zn-ribbon protein
LPTDTNYNTISGKKLGELKAMAPQALLIKSSVESSSKEKLSKMQSHRDILKEVKKQNANAEKNEAKNEEKIKETPATTTPVELKPSNSGLIASDFLAKRVNEIKRLKANLGSSPNSPKSISSINSTKTTTTTTTDAAKSTDGFDLELYIGDSVTSKKLLDVNNKYVPFSPKTCTSESYKRKLAELSPAALNKPSEIVESADEKKQKKLKLMDEILSIKSNHSKEVFDPDKNPQLRAYYDKLQQQEEAANRLCNMKNREVKVVSCKTCDYTAFSQSDFCKLKKHAIIRHNVMQRFFKCKSCSKRMYTLDQIVPTKPCSCGAEKYEICTMKEEDISLNIQKSSKVDLDSETPFG